MCTVKSSSYSISKRTVRYVKVLTNEQTHFKKSSFQSSRVYEILIKVICCQFNIYPGYSGIELSRFEIFFFSVFILLRIFALLY